MFYARVRLVEKKGRQGIIIRKDFQILPSDPLSLVTNICLIFANHHPKRETAKLSRNRRGGFLGLFDQPLERDVYAGQDGAWHTGGGAPQGPPLSP